MLHLATSAVSLESECCGGKGKGRKEKSQVKQMGSKPCHILQGVQATVPHDLFLTNIPLQPVHTIIALHWILSQILNLGYLHRHQGKG